MKRVRVVYEGAAEDPCDALDGRTPLEASASVNADTLAKSGRCGCLDLGSPKNTYRPAERIARLHGIKPDLAKRLEPGPLAVFAEHPNPADIGYAFRGSFVTLDNERLATTRLQGLSLEETSALLAPLSDLWEKEGFTFQTIGPGSFLVLYNDDASEFKSGIPPFLAYHEPWTSRQPLGARNQKWKNLFSASHDLLTNHPVNEIRIDLNEDPANGIWLWGGGEVGSLWKDRVQYSGIMLSQSRSALGFAKWAGMESVLLDTPWSAMEGEKPGFRIARVVELLRNHDNLTVYVGSPGSWGWYGNKPKDKARALNMLDQFVLKPLLGVLDAYRPYQLLLTADSKMSVERDQPSDGLIPFLISGDRIEPDDCLSWTESGCEHGTYGRCKPEKLFQLFERTV